MKRHSAVYTVLFALGVCVVCGAAVATTVVVFEERQREYQTVQRLRHVLLPAGLAQPDEELTDREVYRRTQKLRPLAVDLQTGELDQDLDYGRFNQRDATQDPTTSRPAPENTAGVHRLPSHAIVYEVPAETGEPRKLVFPIQGLGHNGPIFGYIALDIADLNTVRGIGFYEHQETRGVAELDNLDWQARWDGRRIFDRQGRVVMELVRDAGPAETDPNRMDAFTGATVTSIAVRNMLQFWFGERAFGPFIANYQRKQPVAAP
jgi:Na+-transporting NADH:ubiquinone oxidoreductase subunit C